MKLYFGHIKRTESERVFLHSKMYNKNLSHKSFNL